MRKVWLLGVALAALGAGLGVAAEVVEGQVKNADGQPAAGAAVGLFYQHCSSTFGAAWLATGKADAEGRFRLEWTRPEPPSVFVGFPVQATCLVVSAPGHAPAARELLPGGVGFHHIQLEKGRRVTVTLGGEDGKPVSGAVVRLLALSSQSSFVVSTLGETAAEEGAAGAPDCGVGVTNAQGVAVVDGAPMGRALLRVSRQGVAVGTVLAPPDKSDLKEAVPGVTTYSGQVLGPDSNPAAGMLVVERQSFNWALTDAGGRFALTTLAPKAGPGGKAEKLTVTALDPAAEPAASPAVGELGAGGAVIKMSKGKRLSGQVTDSSTQAPLAGAAVLFGSGDSAPPLAWLADRDGRYVRRSAEPRMTAALWPPVWRRLLSAEEPEREIELGDEDAVVHWQVATEPVFSMELLVLTAEGGPAPRAIISMEECLHRLGELRLGRPRGRLTAGADGRVYVVGLTRSRPVRGYARSSDSSQAACFEAAPAAEGATQEVAVRLSPARSAVVELRDENGQPFGQDVLAGLRISLPAKGDEEPPPVSSLCMKAAGGAVVKGLLPGVEYSVMVYGQGGGRTLELIRDKRWSFAADEEKPRLVVRARLKARGGTDEARSEMVRRDADFFKAMSSLEAASWKAEDPVEKGLVWFGPELALADTERKEVQLFKGLFGYDTLEVLGFAFGADRVWMGTDRGMFAWDRRGRFWNRFAVAGEYLDAPVKAFRVRGDRCEVTIEAEGGKSLTFVLDAKTGQWLK